MPEPQRCLDLERQYRAAVSTRLPGLSYNVKQIVREQARRQAAFRTREELCCSLEWRAFDTWVEELPIDDVLFRLLANFPEVDWGALLDQYLDFVVGCDSLD
jgi:hypothetical protein